MPFPRGIPAIHRVRICCRVLRVYCAQPDIKPAGTTGVFTKSDRRAIFRRRPVDCREFIGKGLQFYLKYGCLNSVSREFMPMRTFSYLEEPFSVHAVCKSISAAHSSLSVKHALRRHSASERLAGKNEVVEMSPKEQLRLPLTAPPKPCRHRLQV